MKSVILIFLIALLTIMPVCAEYIPIPKGAKNTYKEEIHNCINSQVPIYIREINKIEKNAKNERNQYARNVVIEQGISVELFKFYNQLIKITTKYVKTDITPSTDWYGELQTILKPYFKENGINTMKIKYLLVYAHYKQSKLERLRTID